MSDDDDTIAPPIIIKGIKPKPLIDPVLQEQYEKIIREMRERRERMADAVKPKPPVAPPPVPTPVAKPKTDKEAFDEFMKRFK